MKELIPIEQSDTGDQLVNARLLHEFLEVGRDFSTWIKDRIKESSFREGRDFSTVSGKSTGGRPAVEYGLTMRMAQHICMMGSGEKCELARDYFIECERLARANVPMLGTRSEILKQLQIATNMAIELDEERKLKTVISAPKTLTDALALEQSKELDAKNAMLKERDEQLRLQVRYGNRFHARRAYEPNNHFALGL